jgi:putative endonuclease
LWEALARAGISGAAMPARVRRRRPLRQLARLPYIYLGDFIDGWYEELPWRKRLALGQRGEQMAARYLKRRGYLIIARNYHGAGAEVDLVALENSTLVFVEVKARIGTGAGTPQEAVDERKQEHIRRAAQSYTLRYHVESRPARFDVVAITGAGRKCHLEIIKDAF